MLSVGITMNDVDVRFYISILFRRLPYILVITGLATAIAVIVALKLPPVYGASARILAEAPQISTDLARSTVSINAMEQLQIVQQQITTRDNLLALAEKLDIYADSEVKPSNEEIVEDMRSRITFEQLHLNSLDNSGSAVFSIGFKARDPGLAAKVANELAALILDRNQSQRADAAGNTLQFFDNEVARLGAELSRTEDAILKFKNENKDTLPESLEFRRQQQTSQQGRLVSLDREESDLRSRRRNLVETYGTSGLLTAGPISPEQQMLADLNRALVQQLGMFDEKSPSIVALKARIASLQESLHSSESGEAGGAKGAKTPSLLDIQVADIDERLDLIERERTAIVKSVSDLTKSIETTPAVETTLNSLERNRTNLLTQYNTAIAKRAEASIGKQIEVSSDSERFSLLESATPPEKRLSPKRLRIVGLGAIGGLGLGLGVVFLLEMLNKTIRRPSELTRALQIQPLATIPYIYEPGKRPIGGRYHTMPVMGVFRKLLSGSGLSG